VDRGSGMVTSRSNKAGIGCLRGPLSRFHLAFAMLQLDNAPPCGGSRGLERFAPAEREGAVAPGTLTPTIPFWKLCRARHALVERPSAPPKRKTPPGKAGFSKDSWGIGGILGAVLQALVARASGGVQSGSGGVGLAEMAMDKAHVQRPREPIKNVRQL
jgi:hypothetical protein